MAHVGRGGSVSEIAPVGVRAIGDEHDAGRWLLAMFRVNPARDDD
jgi:hypothetical protein